MEEKINYNDVPVEYCANPSCRSLALVNEDDSGKTFYCIECGGVTSVKDHVDIWKNYYFEAHGRYFLDNAEEDDSDV